MQRLVAVLLGLVACTSGTDPSLLSNDMRFRDGSSGDLPVLDVVWAEVGGSCDGTFRSCDGDHMLLCVDGAWTFVEPACLFGCDRGGWCMACRPGTLRCTDQTIEACNDSGSDWEIRGACVPPCTSCQAGVCVIEGCVGKACGSDSCGNVCGTCESGNVCTSAGQCEPCTCTGKVCGDSGCGETCGWCTEPDVCDDKGQCVGA